MIRTENDAAPRGFAGFGGASFFVIFALPVRPIGGGQDKKIPTKERLPHGIHQLCNGAQPYRRRSGRYSGVSSVRQKSRTGRAGLDTDSGFYVF